MASLHSNKQEISGRQVWTGSISLANTLLHLSDDDKLIVFDKRRFVEVSTVFDHVVSQFAYISYFLLLL
jgi:hypothetical protein